MAHRLCVGAKKLGLYAHLSAPSCYTYHCASVIRIFGGSIPAKLLTTSSGVISMAERKQPKGHNAEKLWSYDDQSAWGSVDGWEVAAEGKRQSPIDIQTSDVRFNKALTPLNLKGWDGLHKGNFVNTGHSLQFTLADTSNATTSTLHGAFALKQFHFHWGTASNLGAEHKINGHSYATEIHFVHTKTSTPKDGDSLAVLGVLCLADSDSNNMCTPWDKIKIPENPSEDIAASDVEIYKYLPQNLDYYFYKGSLTTPPFSETVLWYVIKQPLKIPEIFLEKLRKINDLTGQKLTHNFRHCMPLYNRVVETPENT